MADDETKPTAELKNIKDVEPNQALIKFIEEMLEEAKAGKLRSLLTVAGYHDDSVNSGWEHDPRNSGRRLLGALAFLQFEFYLALSIADPESLLLQFANDELS